MDKRMQTDLREKVDFLINTGYDVFGRDPLVLFNGGKKLVWSGAAFVEHKLELEPKENATRPYERVRDDNFIGDGVIVL